MRKENKIHKKSNIYNAYRNYVINTCKEILGYDETDRHFTHSLIGSLLVVTDTIADFTLAVRCASLSTIEWSEYKRAQNRAGGYECYRELHRKRDLESTCRCPDCRYVEGDFQVKDSELPRLGV